MWRRSCSSFVPLSGSGIMEGTFHYFARGARVLIAGGRAFILLHVGLVLFFHLRTFSGFLVAAHRAHVVHCSVDIAVCATAFEALLAGLGAKFIFEEFRHGWPHPLTNISARKLPSGSDR